MDGTFVAELSTRISKPEVKALDGVEYLVTPPQWSSVKRTIAAPGALALSTLSGLVDFLATVPNMVGLVLHVKSHALVEIRGPLEDEETDFRRSTYAVASIAEVTNPFPFGKFMDAEAFTIGLQTAFVPDDTVAAMILLMASIRDQAVTEVIDDGVAQTVKVQQGVAFVGEKKVPSPIALRPYRSFHEIEQPASPFIVRLQSGQKDGQKPSVALFEADGARWKLDAILAIAAYLREHAPAVKVIA